MNTKLTSMFEYQRFDPSLRLAKLIKESTDRAVRELSDDELVNVAAAGVPMPETGKVRTNGTGEQ